MSLTPEKLVEEIVKLYEEVRPVVMDLGIKVASVTYRRKKIDLASLRELNDCRVWLTVFRDKKIAELNRAIGLVSEETWKHYEAMELTDLREIRIRTAAEKDITDSWRDRPEILKKTPSPEPKPKSKKNKNK
jgi:hypothetical protein